MIFILYQKTSLAQMMKEYLNLKAGFILITF